MSYVNVCVIILNKYYTSDIKMGPVIYVEICHFRAEIIIRQAITLSHRGVDRKLYCRIYAAANIVIIFCMD